jgi:hypothetical protein
LGMLVEHGPYILISPNKCTPRLAAMNKTL